MTVFRQDGRARVPMPTDRYTHDCAECVYLGRYVGDLETRDLYECSRSGVIAGRFGNKVPECCFYPIQDARRHSHRIPWLREAIRLLDEKHQRRGT